MKLKSGCDKEYKKRHDEIWPELLEELKSAGICDYTIYLDEETDTLFAVQKLKEGHKADQLAGKAIMQMWWDYMSDIMKVHSDNSPKEISLEEVFHMD